MPNVSAVHTETFLLSIGTNSHFDKNNYNSRYNILKPRMLEYSRLRVRDSVVNGNGNLAIRANDILPNGILFHCLGNANHSASIDLVFVRNVGVNTVYGIEGTNEPNLNNQSGALVRSYQQALWNLFRVNNSDTAHLTVIGPSPTSPSDPGGANSISNIETMCDVGNIHSYRGGRNPEHPGFGSTLNGYKYGGLDYDIFNVGRVMCPNKPLWVTECGYNNATSLTGHRPCTEAIAGRYMPRMYLHHYFNRGLPRSFNYEWMNEGTSGGDAEQNFGVVRQEAERKPAFFAVKNMISLLTDPGASFTPGVLNFTLSGATGNVNTALMQKRDGVYYLAMWLGVEEYNVDTQVSINVTPQNVTVTAPAVVGAAWAECLPIDSTPPPYTSLTVASGAFTLPISGTTKIVRLNTTTTVPPPVDAAGAISLPMHFVFAEASTDAFDAEASVSSAMFTVLATGTTAILTLQARSLADTLVQDNTSLDITPAEVRSVLVEICNVMDVLHEANVVNDGGIEQIDYTLRTPVDSSTTASFYTIRNFAAYDSALTELRVNCAVATTTFLMTVMIDGVSVGGMTNVPVYNGSGVISRVASALNGAFAGTKVQFRLDGIAGTPSNFGMSLKTVRGVDLVLGDTFNVDLGFNFSDSRKGVPEGAFASVTAGSAFLSNGNLDATDPAAWLITSQADSGLFYIMSSTPTGAVIGLTRPMPDWTTLSQVSTFSLQVTKTAGAKSRRIEVPILRHGPHTRLYPLDGVTVYNNQKGRSFYFAARGGTATGPSLSVVGDSRFTLSAGPVAGSALLNIVNTLSASTYTVNIEAVNCHGSATFQRTVTVRDRTSNETAFPWWTHVQNGPNLPVRTASLPQTMQVSNEATTSVSANNYVHFKMSFNRGDISLNEVPIFLFSDPVTTTFALLAQIDEVSYWRDSLSNATSLRMATFILKTPDGLAGSENRNVRIDKQAGTLSTTPARSLSAAKSLVAVQAWAVHALLDSVSYTAQLTLSAMNDSRAVTYARGKYGDGIFCVTKFIQDSDGVTAHANMAVHWYAHCYDDGRAEVMPVIHNTWMTSHASVSIRSLRVQVSTVNVATWFPAVYDHYSFAIAYGGDQSVRAYRNDGTVNTLYVRYDQMTAYLGETGTFHKYMSNLGGLIIDPSPAAPLYVPCGTAKFNADPNQADGPLAGGTNYGNALGPQADWSIKALLTGKASWLNICRILAGEWGSYRWHWIDETTWKIRAANDGYAGGVQDVNRYPGIATEPQWFRTSFTASGVAPTNIAWDNQHSADPYFTVAFLTGRRWWLDAKALIANYFAVWQPTGLDPSAYGFRVQRVADTNVYFAGGWHFGSSSAEREAAWSMKHYSDTEWLLGESDVRYPVFRDYQSDPYRLYYKYLREDIPFTTSNGSFPWHNRFRPQGWVFWRTNGWQPWEADYLASTLTIDVMRRRPWVEREVNGVACYILPTLTYGRGAPAASGGSGCRFRATANFVTMEAQEDRVAATSWSEAAAAWSVADVKTQTLTPAPVPTVGGFPKWYGADATACPIGTIRDANGAFLDATRPVFARGAAIMGVNAGIPNAQAMLDTIQAMANYTDNPSHYSVNYVRWAVIP